MNSGYASLLKNVKYNFFMRVNSYIEKALYHRKKAGKIIKIKVRPTHFKTCLKESEEYMLLSCLP